MSDTIAWPGIGRFNLIDNRRRNPVIYFQQGRSDRSEWNVIITEDVDTPVIAETRQAMMALSVEVLGSSGLSRKTQNSVLEFLRTVSSKTTTFPSVVPDDEGVAVLHWVAGGRSLQVDVEETGATYLWAKEPGHETVVLTEPADINVCAKIKLQRIADDVNAVNPTWRERMRRS